MKQQQSIMLPTVSYGMLFQGLFCSHFTFHLLHALCTHVFYVYHVYALFLYLMLLRYL